MANVLEIAKRARAAALELSGVSEERKNAALARIAELLEQDAENIIAANSRDLEKAAAAGLDQRKEENKILILLSDGRPNDIMAGSQNPGYTLPGAKKPEKEPYCLDFALRDTAGEVRKLRNRKIAVLGVFAGEEEDLAAEKKIFGKDFAYIRDLSNFANVVGRYLKKQILELL